MPDRDVIPDNELDELNIPISHSGNGDVGHITQAVEHITQEQSRRLIDLTNDYYDGGMTYSELDQNLQDLGYTDATQRTQLANAAHHEFQYRATHGGEDSGLTPNQFDQIQRSNVNIRDIQLVRDSSGRPTGYEVQIREEGASGRVTIRLPAPVQLDILTPAETEQISTMEQVEASIEQHVDNEGDLELTDFNRIEINEALQHYMTGDEDIVELSNRLTTLDNIDNIRNARTIIQDIIRDATAERDFRARNDGRPQLLSVEEYQYMLNNNLETGVRGYTERYNGQPIYAIPGTDTLYFRGNLGNVSVPILNEDGTLAEDQDIQTDDIRLPGPLYSEFNQGQDAIIGSTTGDGLRPNRGTPLTEGEQIQLRNDIRKLANDDINFEGFLELINVKYQNLSQNQYESLLNYVTSLPSVNITPQEAAYANTNSDEPLYIFNFNGRPLITSEANYRRFRESAGVSQDTIDQEIQTQRDSWSAKNQQDMVRRYGYGITGEEMEGRGGTPGVVGLLGGLARGSMTVDQVREAYTRPDPITNEGIPQRPAEDNLDTPPIGPSARGLGEPHDRVVIDTNEPIPLPPAPSEAIPLPGRLYVEAYEENQSLYVGFRETFKDVLPYFTGFVGGGIVASYYKARSRGFLNQLYQQERLLLNQIETRIDQIDREYGGVQDITDMLESMIDRPLTEQGYEQLRQLNIVRGRLAGEEDDPDLGEDLQGLVRQRSRELALTNRELARLRRFIRDGRQEEQRLLQLLRERQANRIEINEALEDIANTDYSILQSVRDNMPQVFTGITIGYELGGFLAGYFFPTLVNLDESELPVAPDDTEGAEEQFTYEEPIVEPVKDLEKINIIDKKDKPIEKNHYNKDRFKVGLENKDKKQVQIYKQPITTKITSGEGYLQKSISNKFNKENNSIQIGIKNSRNKGRPLNGKELTELKKTLNKEELERFEGKNIFFSDKNSTKDINGDLLIEKGKKCRVYEKIPIKGINYNDVIY